MWHLYNVNKQHSTLKHQPRDKFNGYRNLNTSPVEDVFHHFIQPTSLPSLYLASPAENSSLYSSIHTGAIPLYQHSRVVRAPRRVEIDLLAPWALPLLRYSAFCLSSLYRKRKSKHCTTHKAKRIHNTKLTYLSMDVRALSVRMQVMAMWTGVYSALLILDTIEESVVSRNSWGLWSNGCAHAVER